MNTPCSFVRARTYIVLLAASITGVEGLQLLLAAEISLLIEIYQRKTMRKAVWIATVIAVVAACGLSFKAHAAAVTRYN